MSRKKTCKTALRTALSNIHLVDKSLILFMLILLVQSAYSLFFPGDSIPLAGDIDIIIRTSAAAIFGYFLSSNFVLNNSSSALAQSYAATHKIEAVDSIPADDTAPKSQIGFLASSSSLEAGTAQPVEQVPQSESAPANCLQVTVATVIGLFCLVILLLLRIAVQWNSSLLSNSDSVTATVAQMRDFVSGCVGFLIGYPSNRSNQA